MKKHAFLKSGMFLTFFTLMLAFVCITTFAATPLTITVVSGLNGSYDTGTWKESGATITGEISASTSSGACGGTEYTAQTSKLTLTNGKTTAATLSFHWKAEDQASVSVGGNTADEGDFSAELAAGGTLEISLTSQKNDTKATIRCIPLGWDETPGTCMVTGKPSARRVLFARAY